MLKIYDLTIEYKHEPLGLDEIQPRFGWKLDSDQQDTVQASYRLRIVQGGDVVWDSGTVASAQSILNEYLGPNLTPRTEYDWTVTVWDNHGETAEGTSRFETGLLNGSAFEGKAQWITHALDKASPVSPVLYKDFVVQDNVKKARLYATALGVYEAEINGEPVDDTYFHPGWTNYRKRLQYQTYAVTLRERQKPSGADAGERLVQGQARLYADSPTTTATPPPRWRRSASPMRTGTRNGSAPMKAGSARPGLFSPPKSMTVKRRTLRQTPPHRSPPDCLTTALTPSSGRRTSRSAACKGCLLSRNLRLPTVTTSLTLGRT